MAKILNSTLPAGSRGLWWFPQGLENLGEAATGDATLSGSTLSGGVLVHDSTSDYTELTSNADLIFPSGVGSEVTVLARYRKTDTTARNSAMFGVHFASEGNTAHALVPFGDGTIYWDRGGFGGGYRLSVAHGTLDTSFHVWGFTVGAARGAEIWKDGVVIASDSGTGNRAAQASPARLGSTLTTIASDLCEFEWFYVHEDQLSTTLIAAISADPEGELTEESGGGGTHRISILTTNLLPDDSGDVYPQRYTVLGLANFVWQHAVWVFANSGTRIGFFDTFTVPQNYVGAAAIVLIWSVAATSGDVVWDVDYRAVGGDDAESLDQATAQESVTQTDTAPSASHERMVCTIPLTSSNLAAGDTVEYSLVRDGAAAADTLSAPVYLVHAYFQYESAA